jgi:hypothetical protein
VRTAVTDSTSPSLFCAAVLHLPHKTTRSTKLSTVVIKVVNCCDKSKTFVKIMVSSQSCHLLFVVVAAGCCCCCCCNTALSANNKSCFYSVDAISVAVNATPVASSTSTDAMNKRRMRRTATFRGQLRRWRERVCVQQPVWLYAATRTSLGGVPPSGPPSALIVTVMGPVVVRLKSAMCWSMLQVNAADKKQIGGASRWR